MADMVPDVVVGKDWVNAFTLSGIAANTAITIQNKGIRPLLVFVAASQPSASAKSGFQIAPNEVWTVDANSGNVWLRRLREGSGEITMVCIQEA